MEKQDKSKWLGRSLENYKSMHQETARKKDCYEAFMACRTLTQARKVLFGEKVKQYTGRRDGLGIKGQK